MNKNSDSQSLSSGDHEVPLKRQEMNKINSLYSAPLFEEKWNGETREFSLLRRRILEAQISADRFHRMRFQIEKIMREEERNLKIRIEENTEMIKQLEVVQEPSMWTTKDDFDAQASAKAEISQIKRRMREKLTNLLTVELQMNPFSHEDISSSPTIKKNEIQAENKLEAFEKLIQVGLTHMLEEKWESQEFNCKELDKTSTEVQRLHSERVGHVNQLEEEPSPAKDVILTLYEAPIGSLVLGDQIISMGEEMDDIDKVDQLLMFQPDEGSSSIQGYESTGRGDLPVAGNAEGVQDALMHKNESADAEGADPLEDLSEASSNPTNNQNSSQEVSDASDSFPRHQSNDDDPEAVEECQDLRIVVGNYYVLASHPHFFNIDWNTHFTRHHGRQFICLVCSAVRDGVTKMQDHIWTRHYGGTFSCPFCSNLRSSLTRHIGTHVKNHHFISSAKK